MIGLPFATMFCLNDVTRIGGTAGLSGLIFSLQLQDLLYLPVYQILSTTPNYSSSPRIVQTFSSLYKVAVRTMWLSLYMIDILLVAAAVSQSKESGTM